MEKGSFQLMMEYSMRVNSKMIIFKVMEKCIILMDLYFKENLKKENPMVQENYKNIETVKKSSLTKDNFMMDNFQEEEN